jgi:hypothetical protein
MNTFNHRASWTRVATGDRLRVLALSTFAFVAMASQPARATALDFQIVNRTNQPIVGVWSTPTSSTSWGPPFRNTYVPEGGSQNVEFLDQGQGCIFDLRIQFSEGAVRFWRGLNLCQIRGFQVFVSSGEVRASTW